MQGTILMIRTDGSTETVKCQRPTLETLKEAVGGGLIEMIPYWNKMVIDGKTVTVAAFCDEEGKLRELPINPYATELWYRFGNPGDDVLCGQVALVFGDAEFMEAL